MKRIFLAPLMFAACFLVIIWFILPEYQTYSKLQKDIGKAREDIAQTQELLARLEEIAGKLEENQGDIKKLESGLPEEFSLSSFFDYLSFQVEANGLLLKNVSIQQEAVKAQQGVSLAPQETASSSRPASVFKEHLVAVDVVGSLSGLGSFIESLYNSSRLVFVSSLQSAVSDEEMPSFSLLLKVYSQR